MFLKKGTTSKIIEFFIEDSTSSNKQGLTGLIFSDMSISYYRESDFDSVVVTPVTMSVGNYVSGGFKEINSVEMPGYYQFGIPDAALTASPGVNHVNILIIGSSPAIPVKIEIELVAFDPADDIRLGLQTLPPVAYLNSGGIALGDDLGRVLLQPTIHSAAIIPKVNEIDTVNFDVGITQNAADKVWISSTRTLTSLLNVSSDIETSVLNALDTPITLTPTTDSINDVLKTLDLLDITTQFTALSDQIGVGGSNLTTLGDTRLDDYLKISDIPTVVDSVYDELISDTRVSGSYGEFFQNNSTQDIIDAINAEGVIVKGFTSDIVTDISSEAISKLVSQNYTFSIQLTNGSYYYTVGIGEDLKAKVSNIITPYGPLNVGLEIPESVQQSIEANVTLVKNNFLDPGLVE